MFHAWACFTRPLLMVYILIMLGIRQFFLKISLWRHGFSKVGVDFRGNSYYETRPKNPSQTPRRIVIYAGVPEASTIPAEWHGWLHHNTTDQPVPNVPPAWQKESLPNLTGTIFAHMPPGAAPRASSSTGGHASLRQAYSPWRPE